MFSKQADRILPNNYIFICVFKWAKLPFFSYFFIKLNKLGEGLPPLKSWNCISIFILWIGTFSFETNVIQKTQCYWFIPLSLLFYICTASSLTQTPDFVAIHSTVCDAGGAQILFHFKASAPVSLLWRLRGSHDHVTVFILHWFLQTMGSRTFQYVVHAYILLVKFFFPKLGCVEAGDSVFPSRLNREVVGL